MAPTASDALFGPFFLMWQQAQMMKLHFVVCALLGAPGHRHCGVSGDGSCTFH